MTKIGILMMKTGKNSLFEIPGDTGGNWRRKKFITYHVKGDADMNFPILCGYANRRNLSDDDRYWLAFLYSTCYCVPTTILLFNKLHLADVNSAKLGHFWGSYKKDLIFQSDRRYVKNMDWFLTLVPEFIKKTKRHPAKYYAQYRGKTEQETYDNLYKHFMKYRYFGRFTTFLMIEALDKLTDLNSDSAWFDWKNGNTATSGMMHILYLDQEALDFDEKGSLMDDADKILNKALTDLKTDIRAHNKDASIKLVDIETSLCGFRKLFKGSRYGGYYFDRVQVELNNYKIRMPQYNKTWDLLFHIRKDTCNNQLLGELGGWTGIRHWRLTDWLDKGVTGVEVIS